MADNIKKGNITSADEKTPAGEETSAGDKASVRDKISVRDIVEFIMNSGDIDNTHTKSDPDAMQEGARLHRKIQKKQKAGYRAEVMLSYTKEYCHEGDIFEITVEGRADGIYTLSEEERVGDTESAQISFGMAAEAQEDFTVPEEKPEVFIDEIKCVYRKLSKIEEIVPVHRAQAMCYAYMYCMDNCIERIGIRLSYCNIETENMKYFEEYYNIDELSEWYDRLLKEYVKWLSWKHKWQIKRNESIKEQQFPFEYRPGQRELVAGVYRTIIRDKKLFIEAPTGVGKTMSTVFPAVRAMGEGKLEKIFYLTAKTITATVAHNSYEILRSRGLSIKQVAITAKEKICMLEKPECNPGACEYAKGHYDRINEALFDMLTHEDNMNRDVIISYAKKHKVCPFEMGLDATNWSDAIICDYNYVFDPKVYLRRYFESGKKQDFVFLIDEAHNLVDRSREMYSAALYKDDFAKAAAAAGHDERLKKGLYECKNLLERYKQETESCEVWESAGDVYLKALRLITLFEDYFQESHDIKDRELLIKLYMDIRHFINIHELMDENYLVCTDYSEEGEFRIRLMCMDASHNLKNCLNRGKSAVFFSATLLPVKYYMEQLGGTPDDYAVYAPSPFDTDKRLLMVGNDISTRYTQRGEGLYAKIADYIDKFTAAKQGNYMVFAPSYQMLEDIYSACTGIAGTMLMQSSSMSEEMKEEFLNRFKDNKGETLIGFCVMGGIFSEGIDLTGQSLIGAVIVGTGLPMVCSERELFRGFYDRRSNCGFEYAYLYNGMNKVLQSAGRVIRTSEDIGAILLLDERFLQKQYRLLFPREWENYKVVNINTIDGILGNFWNKTEEGKLEKN